MTGTIIKIPTDKIRPIEGTAKIIMNNLHTVNQDNIVHRDDIVLRRHLLHLLLNTVLEFEKNQSICVKKNFHGSNEPNH